MGEVIGQIVPLALAVAISPMHLLAVILLLSTPQGHRVAAAFLAGRTAGIGFLLVVFSLVIRPLESVTAAPDAVAASLKIIIGAGLMALAGGQWLARSRRADDERTPGWMSVIDSAGAGKAFGLGALLSVASLKNLTLCLAASVAIGSMALTSWQTGVAIVIFVILGAAPLAAVIITSSTTGSRTRTGLEAWRAWLITNQSAILSVIPLGIGILLIGKGVAELALG